MIMWMTYWATVLAMFAILTPGQQQTELSGKKHNGKET